MPRNAELSIRLLWPFGRVIREDSVLWTVLEQEGLGPRAFADPETRIPHRLAMMLLDHYLSWTGNPALGLLAGERVEEGDLGVLGAAARCCESLGEALRCVSSYYCLMNDGAEITLEEHGTFAVCAYRTVDGVDEPPAVADFVMAFVAAFARRHTTLDERLFELHFKHSHPTSAEEYARAFRVPVVRFGMPRNALLFPRACLALPMREANGALHQAFEAHVRALSERFRRGDLMSSVRSGVREQLRVGDPSMPEVARKVGVSVATLRRHLSAHGTDFTHVLDEVRHELALVYLADPALVLSEVAFLLCFADVRSFVASFKRWTGGVAPDAYRGHPLART